MKQTGCGVPGEGVDANRTDGNCINCGGRDLLLMMFVLIGAGVLFISVPLLFFSLPPLFLM